MALVLSARYRRAPEAKLNDPRSWPSLYLLFALLPLCSSLYFLLSSSFIALTSTGLLALAILIKLQVVLSDRREHHEIFDKGNVPSVGNRSLISGNLFEVIVPVDNYKKIEQLHAKLGKSFGIFYGPDPWLMTTDLDLLQKILISEKVQDRVIFNTPFSSEFQESLAQIRGEKWRKTRRVLNAPFTAHQMRSDNVHGDIERVLDKLMLCFENHPVEPDAERKSRIVDVNYNFKKYTSEVIFQVAFGRENKINFEAEGSDQVIDAINECSKLIRNPIVWASIMFDNSNRFFDHLIYFTPMRAFLNLLHDVLNSSLIERRSLNSDQAKSAEASGGNGSPPVPQPRKMIDSMIDCVQEKKLSDRELKSNLFFMFLAGFETTANTLTVFFWLMAQHQEIQDKLREAVLRDGDKSQYLAWCLQETLRLYPAVPTGIGRILTETIHFNGMTLYRGTSVVASSYTIHRSPGYWGSDVDQFKPERFSDTQSMHPMQFMPFGHGPRRCLGGGLAMAEMSAAVPRILLRYRVERCASTPEVLDITTPNIIHMIIDGRVEVRFVELGAPK